MPKPLLGFGGPIAARGSILPEPRILSCCIADFQSAGAPTADDCLEFAEHCAGCKPAMQQLEKLRYALTARPPKR
jgi:hypothetical protein